MIHPAPIADRRLLLKGVSQRAALGVVLLSIVAAGLIIGYALRGGLRERDAMLTLHTLRSQFEAELIAERVSGQLYSVDLTLQTFSARLGAADAENGPLPAPMEQALRQKAAFLEPVVNLLVYSGGGDLRWSLTGRGLEPADLAALRAAHEQQWLSLDIHAIQPADAAAGGRIAVSRRIEDAEGRYRGMIAAVVVPMLVSPPRSDYRSADIHRVALSNMAGDLLACFPWETPGTRPPKTLTALPLFACLPESLLNEGGLRIHRCPGAILAICQLEGFPLHIGVAYDTDQLIREWATGFRKEVVALCGLLALMSVLILLVARQLARRRTLTRALLRSEGHSEIMQTLREITLAVTASPDLLTAVRAGMEMILRTIQWSAAYACLLPDRDLFPKGHLTALCSTHERAATAAECVLPSEEVIRFFSGVTSLTWVRDPDAIPALHTLSPPVDPRMRTACLVPVLSRQQPVAVLLFLTGSDLAEEAGITGFVEQAVASLTRMSDRLHTEQVLREKEALYRQMFDANQAMKLLIDPEEGRIVDANRTACEFYGYPGWALNEMRITELTPRGQRQVLEMLHKAATGETGYFAADQELASGEIRHVEMYAGPLHYKNRNLVYTIVHDITERNRMEMELIKSKKMEAMGVLAGGIAHDFNNLLTIIMGYIEMAMADLPPDTEPRKMLAESLSSTEKARDLSHQFLALSSGASLIKAPGSVSEVLRYAIGLLGDEGNGCRYAVTDNVTWVAEIDWNKMAQVFGNLLQNAREAMPEGGTIHVEMRNIRIGRHNRRSGMESVPDGDYVQVHIRDTGCGIPERHLQRVLDPYFSTKQRGYQKGMGLGLTSAYSIVRQHGGHLLIASREGKGTECRVLLPARNSEPGGT